MDVLQTLPPLKLGFQYVLVIVNDASRFNRIYLMRTKSESEEKLISFFEELKNKAEQLPAYIHSNRGGEFSLTKFSNQVKAYGISIERGPADLPQTNSVDERFNGVLLEKIKYMLLQSMWHEAALHASNLLNVLSHSSLNWSSPTQSLLEIFCLYLGTC
jgi:transposase InsO family protein